MENNTGNEEWRDVPNYEGYYQASNFGRIRSLDRTVVFSDGQKRFCKGKIIDGSVQNGYKLTSLSSDGIGRSFKFSQLVAMTFLGHEPNGHELVVDHINGDKSDDRVKNLRIVTHRANSSTCFRSNEDSFTSTYVGVYWDKSRDRWRAQIQHDGVRTGLGYYDTELEAFKAYKSALSKIEDGSFDPNYYKPKFASEYKGVTFHKAANKWRARITINGKLKHIGLFKTESEAHQAYQDKLNELNNTKKETHGTEAIH